MGGSSKSSTSTTQNAYDNRTFIDSRQDNRSYTTVDARQDNRTFIDSRQDNRSYTTVDARQDNRTFIDSRQDNRSWSTTVIDDRDDNRVFNDQRSYTTIDESVGEGAIVARDGSTITINETDGGAVQQSLEFAAASQGLTFGALASLLDKQQTENSAFMQAVFANSNAGDDESRNKLVYASLFAGVSLAALIAFRKGF